MGDQHDTAAGRRLVLQGNFVPRGSDDPNLNVVHETVSDELRHAEEFETVARGRIGGSISFVTKFKDKDKDVLFWNGEDE